MIADGGILESSGNVFADLRLPDADLLLAKAELACRVATEIEGRTLTQVQAAELFEVDAAELHALTRGELAGFSLERLIRYVNALGLDVEIGVRPRREVDADARGTVRVAAA